MDNLPVKIIRSPRRKKTVSARLSDGALLIYLPSRMPKKEEKEWVAKMKEKMTRKVGKTPANDEYLKKRAEALNRRYFDGKLKVKSITYSNRQRKRRGSCNTLTGGIRISRRLATMPAWVLDYVIIHELAHLVYPDHSKAFWQLVNHYKYAERARGFLIAKDMEENEDVV